MPRCTYGWSISRSEVGPIEPTGAPSAIVDPLATAIDPRWVSVTEYPSAVSIDTTRPLLGTAPAKLTLPPAAARTPEPRLPAMSMPRCWPPAYGSFPRLKARSTAPSVGQVHALAVEGTRNTAAATHNTTVTRRIASPLVVFSKQRTPRVAGRSV